MVSPKKTLWKWFQGNILNIFLTQKENYSMVSQSYDSCTDKGIQENFWLKQRLIIAIRIRQPIVCCLLNQLLITLIAILLFHMRKNVQTNVDPSTMLMEAFSWPNKGISLNVGAAILNHWGEFQKWRLQHIYSTFISSFLQTPDDDCNFQCINTPTTPCEKMNKMRVFTSLQKDVPFQQPPLCSHEWINKDDRYRNEFNIKPMIFNEKYIDRNVFHQLSSK